LIKVDCEILKKTKKGKRKKMETLVSIFSNLSCSENSLAAAQKISEIFSTAVKLSCT
jgi:hypothetical protein